MKSSPFHNPFKSDNVEDVGAMIKDQFKPYITEKLRNEPELMDLLMSYKGKILACWCSPGPCHADVLREIIEGPHFVGDVVCGAKPGRGKGAYPTVTSKNGSEYANIPAYSRGKGIWKTLSPFFLVPDRFEETMPDGTVVPRKKVTCIENLWQATKVEASLSRESSGEPPLDRWWKRRNDVWADQTPHRHVLAKSDRTHPSEGRHYWNGEYISYEEARKRIYIPFYWRAAEKTDAFEALVDMRKRGVNFQIIGPDGRNVDPVLGLYGELNVLTRPFGHELVLVAMLKGQRVHEWAVTDASGGRLVGKDGFRAISMVWPKP